MAAKTNCQCRMPADCRIVKLDASTGDLIWARGVPAEFSSLETTNYSLIGGSSPNCMKNITFVSFDSYSSQLWTVSGAGTQLQKLIAYDKDGNRIASRVIDYICAAGSWTVPAKNFSRYGHPIEFDGSGNFAIVASPSFTSNGDQPKICLFDSTGALLSSSSDLSSYLVAANGFGPPAVGCNLWTDGSYYCIDRGGDIFGFSSSGTLYWHTVRQSGSPLSFNGQIVAREGSSLVHSDGVFVDISTGLFTTPIVGGGTGALHSSRFASAAGPGCVALIPTSGTPTSFDVMDLATSSTITVSPSYALPLTNDLMIYRDGSLVYVAVRADASGDVSLEQYDTSGLVWSTALPISIADNQQLSITVDDDGNPYFC